VLQTGDRVNLRGELKTLSSHDECGAAAGREGKSAVVCVDLGDIHETRKLID
jgi:hypothetical protein